MTKRALTFSLAIAAGFGLALTSLAQTVATDPVGFTSQTIPAATSSTSPSSAVVSTPFYAPATFVGRVNSVDSANSITLAGATFAANQLTATPHLVRLKSGANTGRFFLITAHDADTLTVDTRGYSFVTGAPADINQIQIAAGGTGDSAEVVQAHTLNTLFPSGDPLFKASSAGAADNIHLFNGAVWEVFFHNNNSWRKSGSLQNQNNTVIFPDDGMFIVRRQTAPLQLTFLGAVPTTTERTDIPGPGSTHIANRFPVGTTIAGTNIRSLPNWQTASSVNASDNVHVWNPATSVWTVYFHNGTSWRKSGSLGNADADPIPVNGTMFVVRRSSASGTQATLVHPLPYTL